MNSPLVHIVRPPSVVRSPSPLLVLLHGVGSNERDLFGLAAAFDPGLTVVSVRAPLVMGPEAFGWFPVRFTSEGPVADPVQAEESRRLLVEFVNEAVVTYGAPGSKVFVAGFSQGGILAASLLLTRPDLVSGVVVMSGRILAEVTQVANRAKLARAQVLVVHGTDDARLPVAHGRASRETLRSLGVEPDYREYPMGHTVSDASLSDVAQWVAARL